MRKNGLCLKWRIRNLSSITADRPILPGIRAPARTRTIKIGLARYDRAEKGHGIFVNSRPGPRSIRNVAKFDTASLMRW
jgi:hypothetical protein